MSKGRILTAATLREKGACEDQVDEFVARWGESVIVTPELCEGVADRFDWDWAAAKLFTATEMAKYQRQRAPLVAEYERQRAPLVAEYERQVELLLAEYERQVAPLVAEYERQAAPLWAACYVNDVQ